MLLAALLLFQAVPPPEQDWGQRLRDDANAFRDALLDSHPGPKDAENPAFMPQLDAAYARAIARARTAKDFPSYVWALRELTAAMNDGHVGIDADAALVEKYRWAYRWPGFVTALREGRHVVVTRDGAGTPPLGAALETCDGIKAHRLAADRIGHFAGRWMLRSRRTALSGQLFLPPDNPWLAPVRSCVFDAGGKRMTVKLAWRPIEAARRTELIAAAVGARHTSPIGIERLADGTVWIDLGAFDSDAQSPRGRELAALAAQVEREAESIRSAPRIVFDLRGNNGGSSNWIAMMANAIWGKGSVDRASPDTPVDWRTSDANYDTLQRYVAEFAKSRAQAPDAYDWAVRIEAGMREARAKGQALWRQEPVPPPQAGPDAPRVTARAFVLTDFGCGSACLDAVDVLTGLGAVQVGQETSADTQYMDIRQQVLADGARIWIPMKVYRGRPRGANVPAVPKHAWTGDMGDTEAIRHWIAGL